MENFVAEVFHMQNPTNGITNTIVIKDTNRQESLEDLVLLVRDYNVLVDHLFVSSREDYYSCIVDYLVKDLKTYSEYGVCLMRQLIDESPTAETLNDTLKLIEEQERSLIKKLANAVRHAMDYEVEITSDLAMMCYNYEEAKSYANNE